MLSIFVRCLGHNLLVALVLATVGAGSLAMAPKESVDRPRSVNEVVTCVDALYLGFCS